MKKNKYKITNTTQIGITTRITTNTGIILTTSNFPTHVNLIIKKQF